ncbi:B3 domain-containing transcription factor VRN1-like isoform X2 [Primulina huaijiensis]|uniref:B3 domain-containing transcription factor VRN1-like isoform X2 n=1 Tax=Primulina huaijiensis TaxID=1492673 RepID=UPI003CC766F9
MAKDYSTEKGDGSGSNGCGIYGAKVPKFFKIVSNPGEHRLRLPPEFTRKYGHNLPDCVSLKVPNGLLWKVELQIHSNHEAWLHRGWRLFEEYYSIQLGHLLLFKYVGKEHFEVHIFDTTATEIQYSYYDSLERNAEILAGKSMGRENQDVDDIDEHSGGTELKQVQQRARDGNNIFEAYTRASIFMSKKPIKNLFSIVVMHPSYVSNQRSALHIPPVFSKAILPVKVTSSILLVSEGKTWPVRYICGKKRASLTSGWREFAGDNDLKVGDVCVFEVSNRINLTWDVIIFRA